MSRTPVGGAAASLLGEACGPHSSRPGRRRLCGARDLLTLDPVPTSAAVVPPRPAARRPPRAARGRRCRRADGAVLPLFVFDDRLWGPSGDPRRRFLLDCLADLARADSTARWSSAPATRPPSSRALAAEVGAGSVHVSADAGPYGRRRDAAVERALGDVPLVRTGSPYAVTPGPRDQGATARPFQVFTPFARAWREHGWRAPGARPRDRRRGTAASAPTGSRRAGLRRASCSRRPGRRPRRAAWRAVPRRAAGRLRRGPQPARHRRHQPAVGLPQVRLHPSADAAGRPRRTPSRRGRSAGSPTSWPGGTSTPTSCGTGPETAREYLEPELHGRMGYDTGPDADERFAAWDAGPHRLPDRRRRHAPAARRGAGCTTGCG